ncbi:glycosyltransferase [Actinoalloteichus fjordicus]|uniref:glycosyltransferase n=1 Tax=Actinoalloteichus fjordicus TaxID=1612552 RepID=UPI000952ACDC|nr:glycosyltransferase [Actinoalloteichus fjordicus]
MLILALDAPFLGIPPLLAPETLPNLVLVPRSTARIHAPTDRERIAWESYGLLTAAEHGSTIATISQFMHTHLGREYHIPDHALRGLPDGLSPSDWQLSLPADLPEPASAGFLFSMGRAVPYKGFDDLLDALTVLRAQGTAVPHLVLAAVTDHPEPGDYQHQLARTIARRCLDVTLLTRFDPDIRCMLVHPALAAVVVPSRAEPFGRVCLWSPMPPEPLRS